MGHKIMTGTIDADAYSSVIKPGSNRGFNLGYSSGGTLACTLYLQQRNDNLDTWDTVDIAVFPEHPAGSAVVNNVSFVDAWAEQYRVFADVSAGSGDLTIWMNI